MSHVVCTGIFAGAFSASAEAGPRSGSADPVVLLESMKVEVPVLAEVTKAVVAA